MGDNAWIFAYLKDKVRSLSLLSLKCFQTIFFFFKKTEIIV